MDIQRFTKSPAGRLVKVGQGEAAYWAFIPHPLPPEIAWNTELASRLSTADRTLGELAGLGRSLPNPHLLIGPFLRREAVLSSRIEGTQTDLPHLYAYEAGQLALPGFEPLPSESDLREVANYVHALEYGLRRIQQLPVSLRLLKELHERLLKGVRGDTATPGEFRRTQNWIGAPGCTLNEAHYVPPPPDELMPALDAFEKYIYSDQDTPPLLRLAFLHYQCEAIHPFVDGNGRIGRLLISLLLVHWGILPLPLLYLSAWFEKHRQEYYRRLLEVSAAGDWMGWIHFFLQGVSEQAQDANSRLKQLLNLQTEWRRRVTQARSSALLLNLVDMLFEMPICTIPQVAERLHVRYPSAKNAVERLVQSGILSSLGDMRYGKVFIARQILDVLRPGA
ncbi:MAG: Fic family protein [Chloroflexota bacterium]